jgi:hypothetical protein
MGRDVGCDGAGSSSCRGGQGFEGRHLGGGELVSSGIRFGGRVSARGRELGVGSSRPQDMERWNLNDQKGASRGRVLLRDQNPIRASTSKKKEKRRDCRTPNGNSRLVDVLSVINHENQQQQGAEQRRETRCRQRMGEADRELRACDSGAGSLFCLPPGQRPRRGESSPTDTTHRAPTSVCTLSSPHPTRPHT